MSDDGIFTNLRGGPIYAAARVAPTTARTWQLQLGEPRKGGHPRYDWTDAVILRMMAALALDGGLPPARAAVILNNNRDTLRNAMIAVRAHNRDAGKWCWEGGPYLHVKVAPARMNVGTDEAVLVDDGSLLDLIGDRHSGALQLIVALPRHICSVLLELENVHLGNRPVDEVD